MKPCLCFGAVLIAGLAAATLDAQDANAHRSIYARDNLVAWCIVPFDANQRSPAERAAMVKGLGISKVAYDWRQEHIPTFEEEVLQYKKHGIEFFAFWSWHDDIERLIKKHGIKPQIWKTCPSPSADTQQQKVAAAVQAMLPLVRTTRRLGLQLGLYNHGGWGGEPQNLVAVCQALRARHHADHVGIVYNFHHGHRHISNFADALQQMQPYVLCLNLNGMADAEAVDSDATRNKILPIGSGSHERTMLRIVRDSGYAGPIGILDHRRQLDAEKSLRQNLVGLRGVLREMGDQAALQTYR